MRTEFKKIQEQADSLVQILLNDRERLKAGLRWKGAHTSFGIKSIRADINNSSVWVKYEQYRSDPMFDDYINELELPLEFFEVKNYKTYIANKERETKKRIERNIKNSKRKKLKEARRELFWLQQEIDELEDES